MGKVDEEKIIEFMEKKLAYYKMLYELTNHSKKKARHKFDIKFQEEIIAETKEEYGW